jgi:phosphatidylglycerol---prolipoprotein diacylglyceryl transferase
MVADPIVHHPFMYYLGPIPISGFGLAVLGGFLIGGIVGTRELARRGFDHSPVEPIVVASVIGFLIGAKAYYAVLTGDVSILWSTMGYVFWGGLAGGVAAGMLMARHKGMPIMRISDVAGPGIAAGYAVGRTGCWAVGDDYGRPYDGPLAVAFPQGAPASTVANMNSEFHANLPASLSPDAVVSVYPTQLLEVALGLVMFWILWRLRRHAHGAGWLFGMYCVLAGVERFVVEFFRAKGDVVGPLTSAQWVALVIAAVGGLLITTRRATTTLAVAR